MVNKSVKYLTENLFIPPTIFDQVGGSVIVDINNVANYVTKTNLTFNDFLIDYPRISTPFALLWMVYGRYGYLISSGSSSAGQVVEIIEYCQNAPAMLQMRYQMTLTGSGKIAKDQTGLWLYAQPKGELNKAAMDRLAVPLFALSLWNCNNVSLRILGKTESTLDLFELQVGAPGQLDEANRKTENTIIRGHQKDFRQGPGLFAKHHGIFWWGV